MTTSFKKVIRRVSNQVWNKNNYKLYSVSGLVLATILSGTVSGKYSRSDQEIKPVSPLVASIRLTRDANNPVYGYSEPVVTIKIEESAAEKQAKIASAAAQKSLVLARIKRDVVARSVPLRYDGPVNDVTDIAKRRVAEVWGDDQWTAFYELVRRESGWRVGAKNAHSGACGLGQALPCSKMGGAYGNPEGEINWTIGYVAARYKTPSNALAFHNVRGWY